MDDQTELGTSRVLLARIQEGKQHLTYRGNKTEHPKSKKWGEKKNKRKAILTPRMKRRVHGVRRLEKHAHVI